MGKAVGVPPVALEEQVPAGAAERPVGEIGERARHLLEGPEPGNVGDRHGQGDATLRHPEAPHDRGGGLVGRARGRRGEILDDVGVGPIGTGSQQGAHEFGLADTRESEEGAVAKHRGEEPPAEPVGRNGSDERRDVVVRLGGGVEPAFHAEGEKRRIRCLGELIFPGYEGEFMHNRGRPRAKPA